MADVVFEYGANIQDILTKLNQIDKTNEKVYRKAEQEANKAINGIIKDHQRLIGLTKQLDKSIDDEAKQYKKLADEANKAAKAGQEAGEKAGKASQFNGVQLGIVSGVVSSLVTEFINLGKQAVDVLVNIGKQSVETAVQFDTLKARLGGIFDGSEEAAGQAFNFIQKKSKELGIDLSELAGAFIPKTENLQQFERVAKLATALARSDPEQGAIGARIALIEALSGTFTSLQRRFEIPKQDIDRIKEAFDTKGMEGFISELEKVLSESGKSFEDLANTAQTSFDKAAIAGQQFLGQLGSPVVEELKAQFDELNGTLTENGDDLALIADAFGRVLANIVDIVGTGINDFLANLDTEQVIKIAETFFDIVDNARTLAGVLSQTDIAPSFIDNVQWIAEKLNEALETAIKLSAIVKAETARQQAEQTALSEALGSGARRGAFGQISAGQASSEQEAQAAAAGQEAYNKVIETTLGLLDESTKRKDANREATDNLRKSLEDAKDAGTGEADAILKAAAAQKQAAEDADKLKEAQDKVNKAMEEAEKDLGRKLEDIDRNFERKKLDIAIEFAQKREDAAKANLEKLADIEKKYAQDVDDAATELGRKEEDIARKYGEQRIDLEREQRQKRVDIEREYRLKLQDIQRQFLLDADEAEKNRDAVAFLRAIKERDKQVQDAQINRDRDIQETQLTGQQRKQELDLQRQRELEDARIANERKLEDLKTNLDRQIEAQNTAYSRQIEDLRTGEARKLEEAQTARQRDIDDAKLAHERKISDLQESLAAELEVLKAGNAALEDEAARHNDAMRDTGVRQSDLRNMGIGSSANTPTHPAAGSGQAQGSHPGQIPGFASGGFVTRGHPYIVGERGPELFTPNQNGMIIPNSPLLTSGFGAPSTAYNVTNNNNKSASLGGLLDAGSLDSLLAAKVQNILISLLGNM